MSAIVASVICSSLLLLVCAGNDGDMEIRCKSLLFVLVKVDGKELFFATGFGGTPEVGIRAVSSVGCAVKDLTIAAGASFLAVPLNEASLFV